MADERLQNLLNELEQSGEDRYRLEPQLRQLINDMRAAGEPIPPKLRELDVQLQEEAFEADIDNMPV